MKSLKKPKKSDINAFMRAFFLTSVITACLLGGLLGVAAAYEGILASGYGVEQSAFSATDFEIRIFDLIYKLN